MNPCNTKLCHKKSELINAIQAADCTQDLFPFISKIIPIQSLKATLINHIQSNLNSVDNINKTYYSTIDMNQWIPLELLQHILSFLPFNINCKLSRISKILNTACFNTNIYYKTCQSLILVANLHKDSISYDHKYKRLTVELPALSIDEGLQTLCCRYFYQFKLLNIQSVNHSMEYVYDILKLKEYNKIEILHTKSRTKYNFFMMSDRLKFINIPCLSGSIWNTLITECKNLHGIMLICKSVNNYHRINVCNNFISAPNLWFLSINSKHMYQASVINSMLSACPNLRHLSLNLALYFETNQQISIVFPSKLISLHLGEEMFVAPTSTQIVDYQFTECINLSYLKLSIDFHIDTDFNILFKLLKTCISTLKVIYINQFEAYFGEEFDSFITECKQIFNKYYQINTKIYVSMDMENEEYEYIGQWFKEIFSHLKSENTKYFYNKENEEQLFLSTVVTQISSDFEDYKSFLQQLVDFKLFQDVMDV